jgi:hypothetical protein
LMLYPLIIFLAKNMAPTLRNKDRSMQSTSPNHHSSVHNPYGRFPPEEHTTANHKTTIALHHTKPVGQQLPSKRRKMRIS